MADQSLTDRLTGLRARVAEADRHRATAEGQRKAAEQRLAEIDREITALGVKPDKAAETLAQLEATLGGDLETIEAALAEELQAYQTILSAS